MIAQGLSTVESFRLPGGHYESIGYPEETVSPGAILRRDFHAATRRPGVVLLLMVQSEAITIRGFTNERQPKYECSIVADHGAVEQWLAQPQCLVVPKILGDSSLDLPSW